MARESLTAAAGRNSGLTGDIRSAASAALTDATEAVDGNSEDADTDVEASDEDDEEDEGVLTEMSSLCPLWDNMLPLDATTLKSKQVSSTPCKTTNKPCFDRYDVSCEPLMQVDCALKDLQLDDMDKIMVAMEVLARLAWSDDEVGLSFTVMLLCLSHRECVSVLPGRPKICSILRMDGTTDTG